MLAFFESMLKLLKFQKIETDNFVFRLHYKVSQFSDINKTTTYISSSHFLCWFSSP